MSRMGKESGQWKIEQLAVREQWLRKAKRLSVESGQLNTFNKILVFLEHFRKGDNLSYNDKEVSISMIVLYTFAFRTYETV